MQLDTPLGIHSKQKTYYEMRCPKSARNIMQAIFSSHV